MMERCYHILRRMVLLRGAVQRFEKQMLKYYPQNRKKAREKAAAMCCKLSAAACLAGVAVIYFSGFAFEPLCMIACSVYMIGRYILYKAMTKEEKKLLEELEQFLGELRFQYSYCQRIDEALEESVMKQNGMMAQHGKKLIESLERQEDETEFSFANRYLALLYGLCRIVYTYGDSSRDGESVCLIGIGMIKEAVEQELLKLRKTEHLFSGLLLICLLPNGFIKVIELWATANMEELSYYYEGSYGMLTTLMICLCSVLCFHVIQHLQYGTEPVGIQRGWLQRLEKITWIKRLIAWQINRNYAKSLLKHQRLKECEVLEDMTQFILLQYVTAIITGLIILAGMFSFRTISRMQIVLQTEKMLTEVYQIQEVQRQEMNEEIRLVIMGTESDDILEDVFDACPQEMKTTVKNAVDSGRKEWQSWGFSWYMWLLPGISAVLAYYFRYWLLLVKRRFAGMRREEEILNFQSVVIFMKHLESICGEDIMCWLERYACYFKERVNRVLYTLEYQDYEELETAVEEEVYLPLKRILEGVCACDRLPVADAFGQAESDYHYTIEKYIQECTNQIQDKSAVSRVLAFIPLYLTIGMKLIVPFVLEGMNKLSAYAENMKQFMK